MPQSTPTTMLPLESILPLEEIRAYFEPETVVHESLTLDDLDDALRGCSKEIFDLAINSALRVKQLIDPNVDFIPLQTFIANRDPNIITPLSDVLGGTVLQDLYVSRCKVNGTEVASAFLAQVYPNDIYIGLVMFADPKQPIPSNERLSSMHHFRGLGLLETFLSGAERCGQSRACEHITLVANESSQMELFKSYGFAVDDYEQAREKAAAGRLIPMSKPIAKSAA